MNDYLNNRGISDKIIADNGIHLKSNKIAIPIKDASGNIMFYKYRRSPQETDGPKYMFDKGSTAALFNIHKINDATRVFITEGEFDAMALESYDLHAVSTTNGSGTFKEEWAGAFKGKEVFICYDNDDAGRKGAIKVAQVIPWAKIVWLPEKMKGKDVTDYLLDQGIIAFNNLLADAKSYALPPLYYPDHSKKSDYEKELKQCNADSDYVLDLQRKLKNQKRDWQYTEWLLASWAHYYEHLTSKIKSWSSRKFDTPDFFTEKDRARLVPMDRFIQVNNQGFAKCPFHDEDTPSFRYYARDNHGFCYGGCRGKDVIDVYMKKFKVDFKTAINKLLSS